MRNRSRTTKQNYSGSWKRRFFNRTVCTNPATQYSFESGGGTFSPLLSTQQVSDLSDLVSPAADKKKKEQWRKRRAILRRQERGFKLRQFMPAHPCTHTTTTIQFRTVPSIILYSNGDCGGNKYYSESYDNAAVYARAMNWATNGDPGLYFKTIGHNGSSSPFRQHDWFALTSQFNEACDSFIPSSMLLGETMYEHAIFVDALKYVVNPSRAVKDFLWTVGKLGFRRKRLGEITSILRESSNTWLSYNFGVKPAIRDIRSALTAHEKVQARLWYLANNGGSYVPIRVRQKFSSDFANSALPNPIPTGSSTSFRKYISSKESTATIGAWGKVRDDLDWKDTWTAYTQHFGLGKVIGLAWELIPFSFVVDWFTNAQERINELTRFRTGDPFAEIRNLTCSIVEETKYEIIAIPGWNSSLGMGMVNPNSPFKLADISQKKYSRFLTIPDTSGVVDFSSLGLFQAIASGALLVQRAMR